MLTIAFAGLATQILLKKNGRFPVTSIGHNKNMRKLGITCEKCDEEKRCNLARKAAKARSSSALSQEIPIEVILEA